MQPREGAYVGASADYSVYVELDNSFLYRALEQVSGREAEQAMVGLGTGLFVGIEGE